MEAGDEALKVLLHSRAEERDGGASCRVATCWPDDDVLIVASSGEHVCCWHCRRRRTSATRSVKVN